MDKESEAFQAGQRGEIFTGGTFSEQLAHERGQSSRTGTGGGASPIVLLFAAQALVCLAACFWPLVPAITVGIGYATLRFLDAAYPGHSGATQLITVVVGGLAFYLSIKLERWLQRWGLYRFLRHVARLVALAAFFTYLALTPWSGPRYYPDDITLRWVDSQLTPTQYVWIFIGLVVAHLLSRRWDERIENWMAALRIARQSGEPSSAHVQAIASGIAEQRASHRAKRWAQRLKAGGILGAIGVVFLLVIGEPAGSVVFGFCFFALIGALLSRFVPWQLFARRPKPSARQIAHTQALRESREKSRAPR